MCPSSQSTVLGDPRQLTVVGVEGVEQGSVGHGAVGVEG